MIVHSPPGIRQSKKRGRGPSRGRGKTCGRGTKGQKARGSVRPGFEGGQMPLYRRVARRGFTSLHQPHHALSLSFLDRHFEDGQTVTLAVLKERKLISRSTSKVKILATGKITKKLVLEGLLTSEQAKELLKSAGSTITEEPVHKAGEKEEQSVESN